MYLLLKKYKLFYVNHQRKLRFMQKEPEQNSAFMLKISIEGITFTHYINHTREYFWGIKLLYNKFLRMSLPKNITYL